MKPFFVTGTDTDVGKTFVSSVLLEAMNALGQVTLGLKPVAAGGVLQGEQWVNDDALRLMQSSSLKLPYEQINPVFFRAPASPHIAAKLEQRRTTVSQLVGYCRGVLMKRPDFALVEGAGGWRVPLNDRELISQVAVELGFPVILVVSMRLGCINHAALTAEAIRRDGLKIAGWCANSLGSEPMAHYQENLRTISGSISAPLIGEIPFVSAQAPIEAIGHIKTQYLT